MNKFLYISLFMIIFFSCKKQEETFDTGADYFPIRQKDSYIIYDVQSTTYGATVIDTSYQLMEKIGDTALLNGRIYYKILRFKRPDSSATWPVQPDSVWYEYTTTAQAERTENNKKYIKLVFPVEEGKTWNGNVANTLPADNYSMERVGKSYIVNGHYFPTTLKVVQSDDTSLVNSDQRYEVYAKGLGLIDKYENTILLCSDSICIENYKYLHIQTIIGGVRYIQKFNSYQ